MSSARNSSQILIALHCVLEIIEKQSNIKFRENPSSGSRVIYADGRTDMTKLIAAFRNFTNAPKNVCHNYRPTGVRSVSMIMKTTPAHPRTGKDMITVWELLNCSILYVPKSAAGVHERSGRSEPSTSTCHHLPLAAASNTCIALRCARSLNTAHSYWVAITYVCCCKYKVKKCTIHSPLFSHPGPVTQQSTTCGYNYCT
jgi:hypothetical protein